VGVGAGPVPDHRCLRHQHVRRCAARSLRSAHARIALRFAKRQCKEEEAMRKGRITAALTAGVFGLSLALGAGTPLADTDKPKYGGTLEIVTVYPTLTALSWDPHDW